MPRKPRQERSKATVDAIVEAGLILLASEGPQGTTTRRIAEVAGVGVGSLYEYFDNREAVYRAMFQRMVNDAVAKIEPLTPVLVRMPLREGTYELLRQVRALLERDDGRYLKCLRHSFSIGRNLPFKPLQKVLTALVLQYAMHHPELLRGRNLPALSYILIYGGTFTVIRHLSDPVPPITFDELAHGLADMVAYTAAGGCGLAA